MFRRLHPASWEWQSVASISVFLLTLAVFLFVFIRALRMKREHIERMSRLPVADDTNKQDSDPVTPVKTANP